MVTAELAVVLPALLLVLAVALSALGLAVDQVRCVDAAAAGARAAARGDSPAAVHAVAARSAPSATGPRPSSPGTSLPLRPGASATAQLEAAPGGAP